MPAVRVHLCGVRGSLPSPGADFAGVGGNTSCVAIAHDDEPPTLVLDAGTGLRNLSVLLDGTAFQGTVLLGHLHWDHMMGLPFFRSGDRPDAEVRLLVPEQGVEPSGLLARSMSPPFFPIAVEELRGRWTLGTYDEGRFEEQGFEILAREIPHKGGRTMGIRVSDGRTSMAYLSDHAPHTLGPGPDGYGEHHDAAVELVRDVDLLVHGAQYTSDELPARFTFGHAAANYCVGLAEAHGVGRVVLFHHDPWRTDDQVAALRDEVAEGASVPIEIGIEGAVIDL